MLYRTRVAAAIALLAAGLATAAPPKVVTLPNSDPQCFAPWAEQYQAVPVPGEEGALPDRARQRLHRQHLAHPDDQDGQGLCRAARRRREAEGVQGRLHRRRRRRADRRDQQLHRLGLRRDRGERAESRRPSSR